MSGCGGRRFGGMGNASTRLPRIPLLVPGFARSDTGFRPLVSLHAQTHPCPLREETTKCAKKCVSFDCQPAVGLEFVTTAAGFGVPIAFFFCSSASSFE